MNACNLQNKPGGTGSSSLKAAHTRTVASRPLAQAAYGDCIAGSPCRWIEQADSPEPILRYCWSLLGSEPP